MERLRGSAEVWGGGRGCRSAVGQTRVSAAARVTAQATSDTRLALLAWVRQRAVQTRPVVRTRPIARIRTEITCMRGQGATG
eukprot:1829611-Rhodomonas_salina.1